MKIFNSFRLFILANDLLFAFVSIFGLSFWFFLGFPFGNHNESYLWLVEFSRVEPFDLVTQKIRPIASFRPLGQLTAWLGYYLSGGSIFPQQIFNFIGASVAWLILFFSSKERKFFCYISCLVVGAFFTGYIYLFHLHGVFYSPVLILCALLLVKETTTSREDILSWLMKISLITIIISLYHPFAILIYLSFVSGYIIEKWSSLSGKKRVIILLSIILFLLLMRLLVQSNHFFLPRNFMLGFLSSYKMTEINSILKIVSFLLSLLTLFTIKTHRNVRVILITILVIFFYVFVLYDWPIIIIWIITCLLKSILMQKWSITFLIIMTSVLPIITASGSPTYSIFVLLVCSFVISLGYSFSGNIKYNRPGFIVFVLVFFFSIAILLKVGFSIPLFSKLVNPLLSEKEKTYQMENIVKWFLVSNLTEDLALYRKADNPVETNNAIKRKYRPPTYQDYLNAYINFFRKDKNISRTKPANQLLVSFGGEKINNATEIYSVEGKYNGKATVWRKKSK